MAASDTTRLLVLGVTRLFGPANGYQLRRELLSWKVDSWANVNPGSIYSMLSTLTSQGFVERFDLTMNPGARPVAVYRATERGQEELVELAKDALTTVDTFDSTSMYAALSLSVSLLTRQQVVDHLERRVAKLGSAIEVLDAEAEANRVAGFSPPHVSRMFGLPISLAEAERDWLTGFIESVKSGEMLFASDDWSKWTMSPSDPGWRMVGEREAYQSKIDELQATA
jgi:DNA-binding PadR family transcriptional regulator